MNDAPETPPSARGRPRKIADASPEAKIARLQAELRAAQAALQAAEAQRVAIVGRAVLAHARKNPAFRDVLAPVLRAEVTRKAERAFLVELLADGHTPPEPSP